MCCNNVELISVTCPSSIIFLLATALYQGAFKVCLPVACPSLHQTFINSLCPDVR